MSGMRPFRDLITYEEAKRIIAGAARPLARTEEVPLEDSCGRVMARDARSPIDVPGFSRAAMDGYAVMARDTFGAGRSSPKHLKLVGKAMVGSAPSASVGKGECVQIATGAPLPKGADAVVAVEETSSRGTAVKIFKPMPPGGYVSSPGSDIRKGDVVLRRGAVLGPPQVGALAASGLARVSVFCKPRVAIFPSGDEIVAPGQGLGCGKVYDINSYSLAALLRRSGADSRIFGVAPDDEAGLRRCARAARDFDVAVFSGGSSVGERDLLASVLTDEGEVLFHGVALKPGKPTLFGALGRTLVFGLPGYPTSCLTNAYVFLRPAVMKMARLPFEQRLGEATLSERIVSTLGRHHLYTVSVSGGVARPAFKESGAITSMSYASGWIEIPPNTEFLEEGTRVTVHYF